jgi:hypothetical protein
MLVTVQSDIDIASINVRNYELSFDDEWDIFATSHRLNRAKGQEKEKKRPHRS